MFWDNVAGVYDVFVDVINRKTHQELKQIVSALIEPEDVILECACGTGLLSAVIAPRCRHLTATDYSEKMLGRAKKNCAAFPNITYARADITALAYPDGAFYKVVAGNVITCWITRDGRWGN
jgi:ubiquinone/menaquinone biosynthesis C-methylase UbiE